MKEISNRIERMEMVEWRKLKWLQSRLKDLTVEEKEKLKRSLIENDFCMVFHVWDDGETKWILDGHHREAILKELESEEYKIPERLPAAFVRCKDRKEAAALVVVFSSVYAFVTEEGLYEHMEENKLNIDDLKYTVNFPGIDLTHFEDNFYNELDIEPGVDEDTDEILQYNIVFNNKAEYSRFISWIKSLKARYQEEEMTISEMILKEIGI